MKGMSPRRRSNSGRGRGTSKMTRVERTFVAGAEVGPEDNEICRISHGPFAEVVLLYFDPVSLAGLVDTLQCERGGVGGRG